MDRKEHWESVYATKRSTEMSWYQQQPARSLQFLAQTGLAPDSAIIDVGGGDSTLVDTLVERRFGRVTVLDISGAALTTDTIARAMDIISKPKSVPELRSAVLLAVAK